jgi:hypothetical protein
MHFCTKTSLTTVRVRAKAQYALRMPSQLHESHILLFRNQPTLAADLICGALEVEVPYYKEARVFSADLTEVQPAEYRADLVIQLRDERPVYAIIVEVQLQTNERKRFAWPAYVANLRAKLKCPVCLLVVTTNEAVARWAAKPIEIGGLNRFAPCVLRPSRVPQVLNEADARANPELAVLSAMAHGQAQDAERAAQIAMAAQVAAFDLDFDRSRLYFDLVASSLSEAARQALRSMDARKYEYQSEFARRYVAQGVEQGVARGLLQGEASGRAALVSRLLSVRFGPLDAETLHRLRHASIAELDAIGERLLRAETLREALG